MINDCEGRNNKWREKNKEKRRKRK